jgi:hypothetical protein
VEGFHSGLPKFGSTVLYTVLGSSDLTFPELRHSFQPPYRLFRTKKLPCVVLFIMAPKHTKSLLILPVRGHIE